MNGHAEFIDLFKSEFWGKGYATEAARAITKYGFEVLKIDKICAYILEDSDASQRVAQKAGLKLSSRFISEDGNELWFETYRSGAH